MERLKKGMVRFIRAGKGKSKQIKSGCLDIRDSQSFVRRAEVLHKF